MLSKPSVTKIFSMVKGVAQNTENLPEILTRNFTGRKIPRSWMNFVLSDTIQTQIQYNT